MLTVGVAADGMEVMASPRAGATIAGQRRGVMETTAAAGMGP